MNTAVLKHAEPLQRRLYVEPVAISSVEAFERLASLPYTVYLDSSDAVSTGQTENRYSILATSPLQIVSSIAEWEPIARGLTKYPIESEVNLPFSGGWMGYLSYEAYKHFVPKVTPRKTRYAEVGLGFYDTFCIFDHQGHSAWVASLGLAGPNAHSDARLAARRIQALQDKFASATPCVQTGEPAISALHAVLSREEYGQHIARIQDYIKAGDCYQVNYTQRFHAETLLAAPTLYRRFREISPAPMSAFLNWDKFQILSTSPETFIDILDDRVTTWPIKGTRPRGRSPAEDQRLRHELQNSAKDHAELLMITDLVRNDLGRVCVPGTVETLELGAHQQLPQVHHLYSQVSGRLPDAVSAWDVVCAAYPGGSVTGAPKVRAMEIIHELESHPREVYTGAIGYFSLDGACKLNIPIRTMIYDAGSVTAYAGGGIVADSDPDAEYEESLVKAKGMREALE